MALRITTVLAASLSLIGRADGAPRHFSLPEFPDSETDALRGQVPSAVGQSRVQQIVRQHVVVESASTRLPPTRATP